MRLYGENLVLKVQTVSVALPKQVRAAPTPEARLQQPAGAMSPVGAGSSVESVGFAGAECADEILQLWPANSTAQNGIA